jgi:hypothetical protein
MSAATERKAFWFNLPFSSMWCKELKLPPSDEGPHGHRDSFWEW